MTWTHHKRLRGLAAWLLPAFFLRSLIPVGFMPMVGPGHRVELILCEGYAPAPSMIMSLPMDMSDAMVVDPRMDMSQAHRTQGSAPMPAGAPAHQDHGSCPYGASSALAAPPAVAIPAILEQRALELAATSAQVGYFDVLLRAQTARGPPA